MAFAQQEAVEVRAALASDPLQPSNAQRLLPRLPIPDVVQRPHDGRGLPQELLHHLLGVPVGLAPISIAPNKR